MQDIVFPHNNEAEFFAMAERLGTKKLVLVYPSKELAGRSPAAPKGLAVKTAVIADPPKARQPRQQGILTFVQCSDADRAVLEQGAADVLFSAEKTQVKDYMHQRGSGLNHVLCALAKKNNVAIGFSFADVLSSTGSERARLLGRMMQNIVLCRKCKTSMVIASFAKDPWQMRSLHDVQAFFRELGMHPAEAQKAVSTF
jgi:hypothetical protein